MAAKVKFVKKEHAGLLRDYLDSDGVTLVFPEVQGIAKVKGLVDGQTIEYDFGGEADVFVDKVADSDHFIFLEEDS